MYWFKFYDHFGDEITSDKKSWLESFSIDSDSGNGRCDFMYTLKLEETPTVELRDWLKNDVYVRLYMSQPIFIHRPGEDE